MPRLVRAQYARHELRGSLAPIHCHPRRLGRPPTPVRVDVCKPWRRGGTPAPKVWTPDAQSLPILSEGALRNLLLFLLTLFLSSCARATIAGPTLGAFPSCHYGAATRRAVRSATRIALAGVRVRPNHLFAAVCRMKTTPGACRIREIEPLIGLRLDSRSPLVNRTVATSTKCRAAAPMAFGCPFGCVRSCTRNIRARQLAGLGYDPTEATGYSRPLVRPMCGACGDRMRDTPFTGISLVWCVSVGRRIPFPWRLSERHGFCPDSRAFIVSLEEKRVPSSRPWKKPGAVYRVRG